MEDLMGYKRDIRIAENRCFDAFKAALEEVRKKFEGMHSEYVGVSVAVLRYPYIHFEISAYKIPMSDWVSIWESLDGVTFYNTNRYL